LHRPRTTQIPVTIKETTAEEAKTVEEVTTTKEISMEETTAEAAGVQVATV
jgi:hypothetical protein